MYEILGLFFIRNYEYIYVEEENEQQQKGKNIYLIWLYVSNSYIFMVLVQQMQRHKMCMEITYPLFLRMLENIP